MKKRIRTEAKLIEFFSLIEVSCVALADYNIMVQYIVILVVYSSNWFKLLFCSSCDTYNCYTLICEQDLVGSTQAYLDHLQ